MRIHTKYLTADDLERLKPEGAYIELTPHGSRKRDHAFEVKLYGEPGKDAHGIARKHPTGGAYGTTDGRYRALTWVEWGDWMVELFKIDPGAIIGSYVGQSGFISDTFHAASFRPEREDAEPHQERWARELHAAADRDKDIVRNPLAPQVERHAAFCRHNLRSNPEGSRL